MFFVGEKGDSLHNFQHSSSGLLRSIRIRFYHLRDTTSEQSSTDLDAFPSAFFPFARFLLIYIATPLPHAHQETIPNIPPEAGNLIIGKSNQADSLAVRPPVCWFSRNMCCWKNIHVIESCFRISVPCGSKRFPGFSCLLVKGTVLAPAARD